MPDEPARRGRPPGRRNRGRGRRRAINNEPRGEVKNIF